MAASEATPRKTAKRRIFIVDDHPVVREGIALVINGAPDLEVCGEAADAPETMQALETARPDAVLVDISLKGTDGLELIRDIHAAYPELPTLVLSAHRESDFAERSIRAGAKGYVMKEESSEVMLCAIREVLDGQIHLSEQMTPKLLARLLQPGGKNSQSPVDLLSDREFEVFQLVGQGIPPAQVAEKLRISHRTVLVYCEHIKKKLDLKNAFELHHAAFSYVHGQPKPESNT